MQKNEEKSYYDMRCEFYGKFRNEIKPYICRFEGERKEKFKVALFLSSFSAVVLAASIFAYFYYSGQEWFKTTEPFFRILIGISAAGASFIYPSLKKRFENKIKQRIMPVVASCFGNLKWCQSTYEINMGGLFDSFIIGEYTNSEYDDLFRGKYKDVPFEIIEARYTKVTNSGKHRRVSIIFDGVIIKFQMNKNFKGHTLVKQRNLLYAPICENFKGARLQDAILEDVEFMKKFKVLCEDQIEARYLLTPSFMKRFYDMKTAFNADRVDCAFYKNNLFIALHTSRDLFSLCSLAKPMDDFEQYKTLYNEIISIYKMIDHFKLNENTGL